MTKKQRKVFIRVAITAGLLLLLWLLPIDEKIKRWLYLLPYLLIGYDILRKAALGIVRFSPFDENFLMTVATVGAFALGESPEAVFVMLFYQIGELFQSIAVGKSRRAITALTDLRPDTANLLAEDGTVVQVAPDTVPVGSLILVRPGERVPIDGTVVAGEGFADTSALTGESVPRAVRVGDEILSGVIAGDVPLTVRTAKPFSDSAVCRILAVVEGAASKKATAEAFITRFAAVYTPAVCAAALLLAVAPPLVRLLALGEEAMFSVWILRALSFLVISCPCALVISIPLTFFAGLGGAGRRGVLIKGSNYIETLSKVDTVAFDKTGTVTEGVFEVVKVDAEDPERTLALAALVEAHSSHPIAASIRRACSSLPDPSRLSEVREIAGEGILAAVDGTPVAVGNEKIAARLGIDPPDTPAGASAVFVLENGSLLGTLLLSDREKPGAKEAVAVLRAAGIRTVMLTGDRAPAARAVAASLGIDEVRAELLPIDKVTSLETIMAGARGKVAFVGDGINDAPVIRRADVGFAMGALGSDAAVEAADVVLADDDPARIALAVRHSKKCMKIVYENIVFAITVKVACLVLGALGLTDMWAAIFADVGVMVIAVLNALRALKTADSRQNRREKP